MPAKKYYAFANGARVGIFYEFWKDVLHLNKVSKPIYKGFNNFEDAQKFMAEMELSWMNCHLLQN